jgi:uncharacterized protein GlcG (DUF336 family)
MEMRYDDAAAVVQAAQDRAKELGLTIAVAVFDADGRLRAFGSMDGVLTVCIDIAQMKAYAPAMTGLDGDQLADLINTRPLQYEVLTHRFPLPIFPGPGAVPLKAAGQLVGAVGVSGSPTAQEDHQCAVAGAAAMGG